MRGTVKSNLGLINHPTLFGEIVVNPGDLVLGDDDGIVIIPQNKMEEVQESARRRVANEKDKVAALSKGITSMELNKLDKVFQSLGAVEE
jgi:4-hydroxy-4-methyl-2-oxoglutarate aldolase